MSYFKLVTLTDTTKGDRQTLIDKVVVKDLACALQREPMDPASSLTTSVWIQTSKGMQKIGYIPAEDLDWLAARTDLSAKIYEKQPPTSQSPTWQLVVKITSSSPIPGGEDDSDAPGSLQANAGMVRVDANTKAMLDWQQSIHHELKSINSKLSFFVFLAIVAIVVSFLGAILR